MLNLLPEDQKKKVVGEYKKRVWVTLSIGIIAVVIISATFLIPVYVMSHGTYSEAVGIKANLDSRIAVSQKDMTDQGVKSISATVAILKDYNLAVAPSALIESVVKREPAGISIAHISYTPSSGSPAVIDISGNANTRDSLVLFSKSLQTDGDFSSVYIPISNFARDKNIDFTVKLVAMPSV